MSKYIVRFSVPVEIVAEVEASDEEAAADEAWGPASEYLDSCSISDGRNVRIEGSLDGVGADSVVES